MTKFMFHLKLTKITQEKRVSCTQCKHIRTLRPSSIIYYDRERNRFSISRLGLASGLNRSTSLRKLHYAVEDTFSVLWYGG